MIERPVLVYMSGNNASGKTTLGTALARKLDWLHLPIEKFDQTYLNDLFSFQRRWSFEAQLHFLSHKIGTIRSCLDQKRNAFIDRSPHEDSQVFAEHFASLGHMDSRAIRTYREVAQQFLASIPQPDLFIYCYAPLEVLNERISKRGREYERRYPKQHLELIDLRYRTWLAQLTRTYPGKVLTIDTSKYDVVADESTATNLADEVVATLERILTPPDEISRLEDSLFPLSQISPGLPVSLACGLSGASLGSPRDSRKVMSAPPDSLIHPPARLSKRAREALTKRAYIAAPFTSMASSPAELHSEPGAHLPGLELARLAPHGVIPASYRDELIMIERFVQACGYATILPHRDVNKWGERTLTSRQAISACTQEIRRSDVLLALPELSFGVHYEIGVAAGAGIPIIVLCNVSGQMTFLIQGVEAIPQANIIRYRDNFELEAKLRTSLQRLASA